MAASKSNRASVSQIGSCSRHSMTWFCEKDGERNGSSYLCTPVAVGRLSKGVRRLKLNLTAIVDTEIDVSIEDRVTVGVQIFGG